MPSSEVVTALVMRAPTSPAWASGGREERTIHIPADAPIKVAVCLNTSRRLRPPVLIRVSFGSESSLFADTVGGVVGHVSDDHGLAIEAGRGGDVVKNDALAPDA